MVKEPSSFKCLMFHWPARNWSQLTAILLCPLPPVKWPFSGKTITCYQDAVLRQSRKWLLICSYWPMRRYIIERGFFYCLIAPTIILMSKLEKKLHFKMNDVFLRMFWAKSRLKTGLGKSRTCLENSNLLLNYF